MKINTDFQIIPITDFTYKQLPTEIRVKVDKEYKGYIGKKDVYILKQEGHASTLIIRDQLKSLLPGLVPYSFSEALSIIKVKGIMYREGESVSILDGHLGKEVNGIFEKWSPTVDIMVSEKEVWFLSGL